MPQVATVLFNATLGAARVVNAGSIKVFAVIIAESSSVPADVVFTNAAGTTVLSVTCPGDNTVSIDTSSPWLTQGLSINVGASTTTVTVFHSQPGA